VDLSAGFQLIEPNVFVPWQITQIGLRELLGPALRHVTTGYYTVACITAVGAHCLGFHFDPRDGDTLSELEFFRKSAGNLRDSFESFQGGLEQAFGAPTSVRPGGEGFPSIEWVVPGAVIVHHVFDRFGPEEHVRIRPHAA
jgi:hypothetical protein